MEDEIGIDVKYQSLNDPYTFRKPKLKYRIKRSSKKCIWIMFILIIICLLFSFLIPKEIKEDIVNDINDGKNEYVMTKGKPRFDKYGVDLNANILDGMYNIGFDDDPNKKLEDWSLYTPPCPYLSPVNHPEYVINPQCEVSSIQIVNYNNDNGKGLPYSLHLDSITNQMKKWEEWVMKDGINPNYRNRSVEELLDNNQYHPFDYGYNSSQEDNTNNDNYYEYVINSRMDETPDPRKRRLFSFIMFNTEFDLLDLYFTEFYDVIDYFVIYESNSTFSGNPKPLYFTRALLETDRYDKFKDKIIPLPCETIVDEDNGRGKAFPKEHLARRLVIEKGLRSVHARHGDIFIHGDLDEMPKVHVLSRLKKCGGWEHLQAGIGGGPKSFIHENTNSYFLKNKDMNVTVNSYGEYMIDYEKEKSLGFLIWFYEYSFNIIENKNIGTVAHPNLAIFDARRSLGQFIENGGNGISKRSYHDPLSDPDFDIYQGYTYTDNTNDRRTGKGFLGESIRFHTSKIGDLKTNNKTVLWNAGWHLSSFLPTTKQFYNKISSYSHHDSYGEKSKNQIIKDIKSRIKKKVYIFGREKKYFDNKPSYPDSITEGYRYNFNATYWDEMISLNGSDTNFKKYKNMLDHEIPYQVWLNPICYSFMIDRRFGLKKKLWWQVIPKKNWKTIRFEDLNQSIIKKLFPKNFPKKLKSQLFRKTNNKNKKKKVTIH